MENFNQAEITIIPNEHSVRITNFVKYLLSSVSHFLADGECLMNDYELNFYGRPWLKEFLYNSKPSNPNLEDNWDNIMSASPAEIDKLQHSGRG